MRTVKDIRLLAADYDGTLAYRGRINAALGADLAAAASAAAPKERILAIVTGRPLEGVLAALEQSELPRAAYPQAFVCEERDVHVWQDGAYQPLQEHNQTALARELALLRQSRRIADELRATWPAAIANGHAWSDQDLALFEQSTAEAELRRGYVELRFANSTVARAVLEVCRELVGSVPNMIVVRNGRIVTFRHAAYGKGKALDLLRQHLGLQAAEVMAVGDSGNDLSMLAGDYGFCTAAVGNADDEVIQAVAARGGVLLSGRACEGIRELLRVCGWLEAEQPETKRLEAERPEAG